MAGAATINARLRCSSWPQLLGIYRRDLSRGRLFIKAARQPPPGQPVSIRLTLPSGREIELAGAVESHESGPRGTGVVVALDLGAEARKALDDAVRFASEQTGATPAKSSVDQSPREAGSGAEPIAAAEAELIQALSLELDTVRRFNSFQVLGVGYGAGTEQIEAAFAALSRRYDSAVPAGHSPELAEVTGALLAAAREARDAIGDPDRRAAELEAIRRRRAERARALAPPTLPPPVAPPEADPLVSFPAARELIEGERFDEAIELFYAAAREHPDQPSPRTGIDLAAGLRAIAKGDRVEAADRLQKVLDNHPDNVQAARALAELRQAASRQRELHLLKLREEQGD